MHCTPRRNWRRTAAMCCLILVMSSGCARKSNVRFQSADVAAVWPAPPEPARVRYLGSIQTSADLKPKRTFGQAMGDFVLGKQEAVGMVSPIGVCTDGRDTVYIADSGASAVHVYDLARERYKRWTPGKNDPPFQQPIGVAFDPSGRILVSDALVGAIFAFDLSGSFLGVIGEEALNRPCGMAVADESGEIYVADAGAHQIVVLDRNGGLVRRLGARGGADGQFNFPTHVAFDSAGHLYVSDSLNFRVQVFAPDGRFLSAIGAKGDVSGTFSQPKGIALDPDDHLYVVDANFEAVQVFDTDGRLLLVFGEEGHGPGQFWLPNGATFDQTGRLWIADSYNRRVQVFQYLSAGDEP